MRLQPEDVLRRDPLLEQIWVAMDRPRCFLTGGYLRDRLLGRHSTDLDLSLEGDADAARRPARLLGDHLGARAHLLGHPPRCVWRVESTSLKVELWPLGGLSLEADVRRRDFTCNALVWSLPHGPLIDLVEGRGDLARLRLRAVARANLEDDPVRLLRAVRLLAQIGDLRIEETTARWIRQLSALLEAAPRERVGQELLSLVDGPRAAVGLEALVELGLVQPAAPPAVSVDEGWLHRHLASFARLTDPRRHPLPGALREAGTSSRLAFLLRAWDTPGRRRTAAYGWPRELRERATRAAGLADRLLATVTAPQADRRELIHDAGEAFPSSLALASALMTDAGQAGAWRRWWRMWQRSGGSLVSIRPLVPGPELARLSGVEPGPALGRLVAALGRAQVRGEVRTAGGARRWLRRRLDSTPRG